MSAPMRMIGFEFALTRPPTWRLLRSKLLTAVCGCILGCQQAAASVDLPGSTTVSSTDLTVSFHTKGKWQLVIRQDAPDRFELPGPLHFCFVKDGTPNCSDSQQNVLVESPIVYPTPSSSRPLLAVLADWFTGGSGGPRLTRIWIYNPNTDQFDQIFDHQARRQNNGEIRIITTGPLAGDIVIDNAGQHAPYRYDISVYRLVNSQYREILNYAGNSQYNDGNPLPVIDAEMPEIERRLHLWKPGDPLPTPARTLCGKLELRHGLEWCVSTQRGADASD
jgi:hypothetical protein